MEALPCAIHSATHVHAMVWLSGWACTVVGAEEGRAKAEHGLGGVFDARLLRMGGGLSR